MNLVLRKDTGRILHHDARLQSINFNVLRFVDLFDHFFRNRRLFQERMLHGDVRKRIIERHRKTIHTLSRELASGRSAGSWVRHLAKKSFISSDHFSALCKPGIPLVEIKNNAYKVDKVRKWTPRRWTGERVPAKEDNPCKEALLRPFPWA